MLKLLQNNHNNDRRDLITFITLEENSVESVRESLPVCSL